MFAAVIAISIGLQVLFVEVGGEFFKTTSLTGLHWGYTIGLAALQFIMGVLLRFVPVPTLEKDFASFFVDWFKAKQAALPKDDTTLTVRA